MHRHVPPVAQRIGVAAAAVVIFLAPAVAQWTADTLNDPNPTPQSVTVPAVGGWDCTANGVTCGNGTGVDR